FHSRGPNAETGRASEFQPGKALSHDSGHRANSFRLTVSLGSYPVSSSYLLGWYALGGDSVENLLSEEESRFEDSVEGNVLVGQWVLCKVTPPKAIKLYCFLARIP